MPAKVRKTRASKTEADISAHRGERFEITLPANATTGYRWEVVPADPCVRFVSRGRSLDSNAIGAAGSERFIFEAVQDGMTTIEAVYKRPWESDAIEKRVFRVKIQE